MKGLLIVFPLVLCVVAEPPAPYPPSGYRPNGPAFELPQKQTQNTPQQQYLPALDPRNPTPSTAYGPPDEDDVSVQGLPVTEQLPIFQPSPINGQQYAGPALQSDLKNLDDNYRQQQYQIQQAQYREYERQRQLEAQANNNANRFNPVPPRQFGRTTPRPEASTTQRADDASTTIASTTESIDLNEGETLDDDSKKAKVTVEVSKQKLQEYPGEFYLNSLAQLQLQPRFVPFQFGQLRAPLILQPQGANQKQTAGYDAETHFAALPSVLAQRQVFEQQQTYPDPALLVAPNQQQFVAPIRPQQQYAPVAPNDQRFIAPVQPLQQYAPVQPGTQFQSAIQPQVQAFPQIQAQPVAIQPQAVNQPNYYAQVPQPNPDTEEVEAMDVQQPQPRFVYQQPQTYQQPQAFHPQYPQPQFTQGQQKAFSQLQLQGVNYLNQQDLADYQNGFQPQFLQQQVQYPQDQAQYPLDQPQFPQQQAQIPQQTYQGQDAFLQSGLDVNQQGNGVDQMEEKEEDDGSQVSTATAVATAFGTRTQPRVQYGVPFPRGQANPGYQTTTEAAVDATTEDGPAVAEATAVANPGGRRKSAKLRSRRIRPVFTLDKSGHLVLADQN